MNQLPIDPEEVLWTPEGDEYHQARQQRALQRRLWALEDEQQRRQCRHA